MSTLDENLAKLDQFLADTELVAEKKEGGLLISEKS